MMDVFEAIKTRRSIRRYQKKPVEQEKLLKILEAARLAPSAANLQPWKFIIVTDEKTKENLRKAYNRDWFVTAPVIVVACFYPEKSWAREGEQFGIVDIAIAMQNLILTAWEQGLGTCWVAAFKENEAKEILGIPQNVRVIAMTPLGYPAEDKGPVVDRKPLEEIVHYDHW